MRPARYLLAKALALAATLALAAPGLRAERATLQGEPEVLQALQQMLRGELGAISQYMVHAEMCENWGYERLAGHTEKRAIVEMTHAEMLMQRMLFLNGMPAMLDLPALTVGKDVKQQLENDLTLEVAAVNDYNGAIAICRKAGDHGSAQLLERILKDEEDHVDFLDAQLTVIKDAGLENYLSMQTEEEEEQ